MGIKIFRYDKVNKIPQIKYFKGWMDIQDHIEKLVFNGAPPVIILKDFHFINQEYCLKGKSNRLNRFAFACKIKINRNYLQCQDLVKCRPQTMFVYYELSVLSINPLSMIISS